MRLTNLLRDTILGSIMDAIPRVDYTDAINETVVDAVLQPLDPALVAFIRNEDTARYFAESEVHLRMGNKYIMTIKDVPTLTRSFNVYLDRAEANGSSSIRVYEALMKAGDIQKHMDQENGIIRIRERLRNAIYSATTTVALRKLLEPELHKFIPKDAEVSGGQLVASAAVVEDMKKLGFTA